MRISSHQFHLNSISNIQFNTANFNKTSVQMATNERITKPSDDPLGAVMLLNLDTELEKLLQFKSNIESVDFTLSQQEVKLTGIVNQIYSLQSLITTAADGSMNVDQLKALGQEMSILFPGIIDLLNGTDSEGKYYFSGSETNTKPFDLDGAGNYAYFGDDNVRDVQVSPESSVASNISGGNLDPNANFLNSMKDYLVDITNPPVAGLGDESRVMMDVLADFLGTITGGITDIGGTISSLDSLADSNLDITMVTSNLRDELSAVDYPEAYIKTNESMAAYESTMQIYSKVTSLSLFSFI